MKNNVLVDDERLKMYTRYISCQMEITDMILKYDDLKEFNLNVFTLKEDNLNKLMEYLRLEKRNKKITKMLSSIDEETVLLGIKLAERWKKKLM